LPITGKDYTGRFYSSKLEMFTAVPDWRSGTFAFPFVPLADKWLESAKPSTVDAMKAEAPVGTHYDILGGATIGGRLRDSFYAVHYHKSDEVSLEVRTNVKNEQGVNYAPFVMFGTQGHSIYGQSSTQNKLAFWWPRIGAAFYAHGVYHPGTKANPFHLRVRDAQVTVLRDLFIKVVQSWLHR
jgi:hypothetical protein